ncbi:MAG: Asp23/Gls24 family envelope stress response protein [Defluviitaleaceae bacterium]|nr:Asp23/Gls24 family envelope stress response protein [Defluviitaleaceae bacterium]
MTEIKKESGGFVRISDEVLMMIARTAAAEADGVLRSRNYGRKQLARCTSVVVKNKSVKIALTMAVRFGAKIHEVSADVQKRVKTAIETMTGLSVAEVNVVVATIVGEKKNSRNA